ncbi:hypothetical protein ACQKMV_03585 [Lysinibacillus sp. NPDC094403]
MTSNLLSKATRSSTVGTAADAFDTPLNVTKLVRAILNENRLSI